VAWRQARRDVERARLTLSRGQQHGRGRGRGL
jgi:hypothetical protein